MEIEKEQKKEEEKGRKDEQETERDTHREAMSTQQQNPTVRPVFAKYGYIHTRSVDLISFPVIG